ncbi:MAG: SDR family oxidoreductase [Deltaproteobacteria bacterium]|nr:SDR family oxidoreductase [Deltaproteobacteria bacterium]
MNGKICIVTGASSGIGKEAAIALAAAGARVVLVCRDQQRGDAAVRDVRAAAQHGGSAELVLCDLGSLASVRQATDAIAAKLTHIDVLINNAGIYQGTREVTADGHELTFATNHLGPFLFTVRLLDKVKAAKAGRIINVSSHGHKGAKLDLSDPSFARRRYKAIEQYCNTKLMNLLFTRALAARLKGTPHTANAMHPGAVSTRWASGSNDWFARLVAIGRPFLRSAKKGAETVVWLATSPEVATTSGEYFMDKKRARMRRVAKNDALAEELWTLSERLAGH